MAAAVGVIAEQARGAAPTMAETLAEAAAARSRAAETSAAAEWEDSRVAVALEAAVSEAVASEEGDSI